MSIATWSTPSTCKVVHASLQHPAQYNCRCRCSVVMLVGSVSSRASLHLSCLCTMQPRQCTLELRAFQGRWPISQQFCPCSRAGTVQVSQGCLDLLVLLIDSIQTWPGRLYALPLHILQGLHMKAILGGKVCLSTFETLRRQRDMRQGTGL